MTKTFLATVAGLAILSGSALAADMPAPVYKAAPPPAPVYNWTGCYVNAGFGYAVSNQDHVTETFPGLVPLNGRGTDGGRGWLGLVGGGCDVQVPVSGLGTWVVGAFGDYDFMDVHGPIEDSVTVLQGDAKQNNAWAVGGRIGYVVTPSLLAYTNGGYTESHYNQVNLQAIGLGPVIDILQSHTYHGWFVGGGTEYALNFSWLPISGLFWRNEYRFSSFNKADLPVLLAATGAPAGIAFHQQNYEQAVMSELVWRFNWH